VWSVKQIQSNAREVVSGYRDKDIRNFQASRLFDSLSYVSSAQLIEIVVRVLRSNRT
jgi:hypothetical protein